MTDNTMQSLALVLMLSSLPLISAGAWNDVPALWIAGLVTLIIGGLIPPVTRFAVDQDDASDDEEAER